MSIADIWMASDWIIKVLIMACGVVFLMSFEKIYHYILFYKQSKKLETIESIEEIERLESGILKDILTEIKAYKSEHSGMFNSFVGVKLDLFEQYMMRYVTIIGVIAVLSPMLGLIGTFVGVWHVFEGVSNISMSDPSIIAKGIKEVIVDTMGGLIVAVIAMILYKTFEYISMKNVSKFEEKIYKLLRA